MHPATSESEPIIGCVSIDMGFDMLASILHMGDFWEMANITSEVILVEKILHLVFLHLLSFCGLPR